MLFLMYFLYFMLMGKDVHSQLAAPRVMPACCPAPLHDSYGLNLWNCKSPWSCHFIPVTETTKTPVQPVEMALHPLVESGAPVT